MKYAIDTEFIDTPTCSALISLAIVAETGDEWYAEFDYPKEELTPWLRQNVVPHLVGVGPLSFPDAARSIRKFVGRTNAPQFWAYFAAYDWYWFCRVFGGMMQMPNHYPHRCLDFAAHGKVPTLFLPEHNAMNDARSLMAAIKAKDEKMTWGPQEWRKMKDSNPCTEAHPGVQNLLPANPEASSV